MLGVVGPSYTPLQNRDAFAPFEPLLVSGDAALEAAGALYGGRKVWVLAKIVNEGTADVLRNDPVERYVLLAHAHDGSLAIRYGFTTVRVVCANTLRAAVFNSRSSTLVKIRHTSGAKEALKKLTEAMELDKGRFKATVEEFRFLASKGCDEVSLRRYVREVAGADPDDEDAAKRTVKNVVPLFESGAGADTHRGTWWGAFNALTEHVTHKRGRSKNSRLDSQWFGDGARLIETAREKALEYAKAA